MTNLKEEPNSGSGGGGGGHHVTAHAHNAHNAAMRGWLQPPPQPHDLAAMAQNYGR